MYRLISQKPDIDPCRTGAAQTGLPEFRGFFFLRDKFSKLNGVDVFFSYAVPNSKFDCTVCFLSRFSADREINNAKWY